MQAMLTEAGLEYLATYDRADLSSPLSSGHSLPRQSATSSWHGVHHRWSEAKAVPWTRIRHMYVKRWKSPRLVKEGVRHALPESELVFRSEDMGGPRCQAST